MTQKHADGTKEWTRTLFLEPWERDKYVSTKLFKHFAYTKASKYGLVGDRITGIMNFMGIGEALVEINR